MLLDTEIFRIFLSRLNSTFIKNSASIGTAICANQAHGYGSPDVYLVGNKFINHTRIGDVLIIDLDPSSISEMIEIGRASCRERV